MLGTAPHSRRRRAPSSTDGATHRTGPDSRTSAHDFSAAPQADTATGTATPPSDDGLPKRIILQKRPSLAKGKSSYMIQAPGTPFDELDLSEVDFLRHDLADDSLSTRQKGWTRYRRFFFVLGILLGAALAYVAAMWTNGMSLDAHMQPLLAALDEQLSSLGALDLKSLDLGSLRMPGELSDLGDKLFTGPREWLKAKDFTVGRRLQEAGYRAEHPVVLLPGIISTGLESWTTNEDASGYFRKRLWGTTTMMRTIVFEKERWIKHLSLDPYTGLDPAGIKVRAAEGLDAASYFVSGYWIWSKIIENLAVLGYDTNNLWLASYDWRLSMHNLEVRDRFFSRLQRKMEENLQLQGKKTVLVSHSMGSTVALYFMKWVEASGPGFGNGGSDWCERHIEAFTSIAGTFLGVPKAMAALLSGEMRDTVELPPPAAYVLERFFSRQERARLFRTWAGSASMLIKGGEAVWGNATHAPDDEAGAEHTHGEIYSFRTQPAAATGADGAGEREERDSPHGADSNDAFGGANLTASDALTYLLQHTPSAFQQMIQQNYSNGIEYSAERIARNGKKNPTTWSNPLEAALPFAPSMKIYCLYGAGKPTERSYWYERGPYEMDDVQADGQAAQCATCDTADAHAHGHAGSHGSGGSGGKGVTPAPGLEFPTSRRSWIDSGVSDEKAVPKVRSGCKMGEGDGTVSLLSLGAMCAEGWKRKRYNPAGIPVVTFETLHEPESLDLRGGTTTGDHVDILGSWSVNRNVLIVAAGRGHEIEDSYVSNITTYAKRIHWDKPPPGKQNKMLIHPE